MSDDYCKIFVKGDVDGVRAVLATLLDGVSGPEAEVRRNAVTGGPESDFVCWPAIVEMESAERQPLVDKATTILTRLWDAGLPAVAACDFEDQLPWRGGIGRLRG